MNKQYNMQYITSDVAFNKYEFRETNFVILSRVKRLFEPTVHCQRNEHQLFFVPQVFEAC